MDKDGEVTKQMKDAKLMSAHFVGRLQVIELSGPFSLPQHNIFECCTKIFVCYIC